jgi:hypothetical protein
MAGELFKKAAAYRKKHKGMSMPEAVKAVSKGAKVSGIKSRVGGVKYKGYVLATKKSRAGNNATLVTGPNGFRSLMIGENFSQVRKAIDDGLIGNKHRSKTANNNARIKKAKKNKNIGSVRAKAKRPKRTTIAVKATVGALDKGLSLVKDIKSLEARRKKLAGKEAKDLMALAINAKHDQLDALKKRMKRA